MKKEQALNSIVDENTVIFETNCTILSKIPQAIIHNKESQWHKAEENYLTLKEIKEQLNGLFIRVISDSGLNGYIYEYGNYPSEECWRLYGITKGYA